MEKRLISLVTALALCLALLPAPAFAQPADAQQQTGSSETAAAQSGQVQVRSGAGHTAHALCPHGAGCAVCPAEARAADVFASQKALTVQNKDLYVDGVRLSNYTSGANGSAILSEGSYYLDEDIAVDAGILIRGTVNLCLNGHSIQPIGSGKSGWFIEIESGAVLNLCDCSTAHTGKVVRTKQNDACVGVYSGGRFALYGGALAASDETGIDIGTKRGVYMAGGAFDMYGGSITGHTATDNGGGVYMADGTFNLHDGSITNNSASSAVNAMASGGGVYVEGGTLTMTGGTISRNTLPKGNGAGVYVAGESAVFNMSGGTIGGASAADGNVAENSGGGGVDVGHGTFTMTGGAISCNRANNGAGVSTAYGTFNLSGGTITGNIAVYGGGGVAHSEAGSHFNLSGKPVISGNTQADGTADNVSLGTAAAIVGALETGSYIGLASPWNATYPLLAAEGIYGGAYTPTAADAAKFHADATGYEVVYHAETSDIYLEVAVEHRSHPVCGASCTHTGKGAHETEEDWKGVSSLSEITKAGNYYLKANVELTDSWKLPIKYNTVVLCLNGHTITCAADKSAIRLYNDNPSTTLRPTLTITDCKGTGTITHKAGNTGDGVNVYRGTLNLYGGTITGNQKDTNGGGVFVNYGTFNMYGGTISNNTAPSGAGVCVMGDVFNLYGGTITGNTATSTATTYAAGGGGVWLSGTKFNMSGGSITGNKAMADGGGVGLAENYSGELEVNLTGGTISGNAADREGGGVYVRSSVMSVSGNVTITGNVKGGTWSDGKYIGDTPNNVYLVSATDRTITIAGALNDAARIGVTLADGHKGVITEGWSTYMGGVTPSRYFVSDTGGKAVLNSNGEVQMKGHAHPICGDSCTHGGGHAEVEWVGVSSLSEIKKTGCYYLKADVEISNSWNSPISGSEVVLCLNGHSITAKGSFAVITVPGDSSFTLTDCNASGKGNGIITHADTFKGRGVDSDGAFTMYGGTITGNTFMGNGAGVSSKSSFVMAGGTISGNTTTDASWGGTRSGYGGGVYISDGTFTMTGGTITGNTSALGVGGVYAAFGKAITITLSGSPRITGNTNRDLFLGYNQTITVGGALSAGANIVVSTADIADGDRAIIARGTDSYSIQDSDLNAFVSAGGYPKQRRGNSIIFYNGSLHLHPVCGTDCAHTGSDAHDDVLWKPISSLDEITGNGSYYLKNEVELPYAWKCEYKVNLCLNGYGITYVGGDGFFGNLIVENDQTFALTDCNGSGAGHGVVTQKSGRGSGVFINGGAKFYLYGGDITGNTATSNGGGVFISMSGDKSSDFYMYGGSITNNKAVGSDSYDVAEGGGVYISNVGGYSCSFYMYGGTISGNATVTDGHNGYGGAVNVDGVFKMYGGEIIGNTADYSGGGVFVDGGHFYMYGGEISGNNAYYLGGGVSIYRNGNCTVGKDARIIDNVVGGTKAVGAEKYTGGTASNVSPLSGVIIKIDDLTQDARIGITTELKPTAGHDVQFAEGAFDAVDYTKIFTPDGGKAYRVTQTGGSLYLSLHNHTWEYTLSTDGASISAQCTDCQESGGSVSIAAPDSSTLVYDGNGKAAVFTNTLATGATVIGPAYERKEAEGYTDLAGYLPTDAGDYRATVEVGSYTLRVDYEIQKAAPTADHFDFTAPTGLVYRAEEQTIPSPISLKSGLTGMGDITVRYSLGGSESQTLNHAGDYSVRVEVAEGDNFNASTVCLTKDEWAVTVARADRTLTLPEDATVINNGIAQQIGRAYWTDVQGNEQDSVDCELVNAPVGVSLSADKKLTVPGTVLLATEITVRVTARANSDYIDLSPRTFTVTVVAKTTKSLQGLTMSGWTYGDAANAPAYIEPEGTISTTIAYEGENGSPITGVPADAGNYTVTVTCETGWEVYTAWKDFAISPKGVTITGLGAEDKTYDGSAAATVTGTAVIDGLVVGDAVTVSAGTAAFDSKDAGENKTVSFTGYTLTGAGADNYTLAAQPESVTAGIAPAVITVSPRSGQSKTFGGDDPTLTYDVTAPITGEVPAFDGALSREQGEDVGEYAITIGGLHLVDSGSFLAGNYTLALAASPVKFAITQAELSEGEDKEFAIRYSDTAEHTKDAAFFGFTGAGTLTLGAVTGGDILASGYPKLVGGAVAVKLKDGLTYSAAASGVISLTFTEASGNYEPKTVTLTVKLREKDEQQALHITGGAKVTFGSTLDLSTEGGSTGSAVTWAVANGTGKASIDENGVLTPAQVGTVTVTATMPGNAQYKAVSATWEVTIEALPIAIPEEDTTAYTYNGAEQTYQLTADAAYTITGDRQTAANEAGYTVTVSLKDTANTKWADGNVADQTYRFVIGKKPIAIPAEDTTVYTYNGAEQTYQLTADAAYTITGDRQTAANEAGYTVTVSLKDTANTKWADGNVADQTYRFVIGKKPIAIPAEDTTVYTYNGAEQTYQLTADAAYTITGDRQTAANEAGYTVTVSLKDTANTKWADGNVADQTYLFKIGKAVVTITAADKKAYTGDAVPDLSKPELGKDYTVEGLLGSDTLGGTIALEYASKPNMFKVGETAINITGATAGGNYTIDFVSGKLTIALRPSTDGIYGTTYPVNTPDKTENGTVSVSVKNAPAGSTVTITVRPDAGCRLSDLTVTGKDGSALPLTDLGDGRFTFIMPAGKVEIRAAFTGEAKTSPFADVPADAYYYEAVEWAAENGITGGVGGGLFAPDDPCTRAQIVTFLWRAAGSPEPKGMTSFGDVAADAYYAKAVAWAVENGVTTGTGGGRFSPDDPCTRAQAVTFLARAVKAMGDGKTVFTDVPETAYYAPAVKWAADNGVTTGTGPSTFSPDDLCTRAQIVTFLWRVYGKK